MRIEFTYEPEDLQDLRKLARVVKDPSSPPGRAPRWGVVLVIAVAIFAGMLWLQMYLQRLLSPPDPNPPPPQPPGSTPFGWLFTLLPWLLIAGFVWFFVYRQMRFAAKKALEDNPELQIRQTFEAGDEGITVSTPAITSSWTWESFSAVAEGDRTIGVKFAGRAKVFVVIPKRAMSLAQLEELRAILTERVRPQSGPFPVVSIDVGQIGGSL